MKILTNESEIAAVSGGIEATTILFGLTAVNMLLGLYNYLFIKKLTNATVVNTMYILHHEAQLSNLSGYNPKGDIPTQILNDWLITLAS